MSAIDDFANEPEVQDGLPEDSNLEQDLAEGRPARKKSSLPLIGAGVVMVAAFSFVAYTKFIKADGAPSAVAQAPAIEQVQAMPAIDPAQVTMGAPAIGSPALVPVDVSAQIPVNVPAQVQADPSQMAPVLPAIGFNAPQSPALEMNAVPPVTPQMPAQMPYEAAQAQAGAPVLGLQGQPAVAPDVSVYPTAQVQSAPALVPASGASGEVAALSDQGVSAHEKIASLEDKLDTLQASIDALLTKIDTIEKKTPVAKKAVVAESKTAAEAKPSKPAKRYVKAKPAKKVEKAEAAAEKYSVYAMRADRVWVRTASGKTMNFAKGETIPGAGRIDEIHLDKRMVELSTGARLVTN